MREFIEERLCGQKKDAAVPEISPVGKVPLGRRAGRFFFEANDLSHASCAGKLCATLYVAVPGFRARRSDAKEYHSTLLSCWKSHLYGGMERLGISNNVVGRGQKENAFAVFPSSHKGRNGGSRGGIASRGLEDDASRTCPDLAQLLGNN